MDRNGCLRSSHLLLLAAVCLAVAASFAVGRPLLGVAIVRPGAEPPALPATGFSHDELDRTLARVVRSGGVDFRRHAERAGWGETTLDFVRAHADERAAVALDLATARGYAVEYAPFDWRLNAAPDGARAPTATTAL